MELDIILGNHRIPLGSSRIRMNILPIPALDGGHIMFLLYEIISRRKPSEKFMEYAQICGMAFLFILLLYANGNDLYRFFLK